MLIFDPLSAEQLKSIVSIQVGDLAERLAARRLILDVTDDAQSWLAEHGYDPAYGARPLRRLIQKAIGDQLAKKLLAGEVRDGDTVRVDIDRSGDAGAGADSAGVADAPGLVITSLGVVEDEG